MGDPAINLGIDPELLRQWLALPEGVTGEIVGGALVTMASAGPDHQGAARGMISDLRIKWRKGGGWVILPEVGVQFGSELREPDLSGWRSDRFVQANPVDVIPDWVCEILSPSTRVKDRAEKMPLYASFRVRHMWIVDPTDHTLEAYRLTEGRWLLLGVSRDSDIVCAEPFEEVPIDLSEVWLALETTAAG